MISISIANRLPELGRPSAAYLPSLYEKKLGYYFMRSVRRQARILNDSVANTYLTTMGQNLVVHSNEPTRHFEFFIVKSSAINAFAGPNGYIGVNAGLILITQTPSELAAVLAHEISHVTQHHLSRGMASSHHRALPTLAAVLAAAVLTGGAAIPAIITGAMAYNAEAILHFTRLHEKEADAMGLKLLANAGYNPKAMALFFERLKNANQYNKVEIPTFLRTHPLSEHRMAEVMNRANQLKTPKGEINLLEYSLVKARLLADTSQDPILLIRSAKSRFLNDTQKPKNQSIVYAYILSLIKINHFTQALSLLKNLEKANPLEAIYPLTLASVYRLQGKSKDMITTLSHLYRKNSDYYPVVEQYSASLLTLNTRANSKKSYKILKRYQRQGVKSAATYMLMAKATAQLKQSVQSDIYRVYAYGELGEFKRALRIIKIAKSKRPISARNQMELNRLKEKFKWFSL
jgi:predicted Zn-dependent protease